MKRCPFCAELIQDQAVKCRFCNEVFAKSKKNIWFFSPGVVIFAHLAVGPLALPLIWFHPRLSRTKKIIISAIVLIISIVLAVGAYKGIQAISEYYRIVFGETQNF